jgi:hypothetical protein
MNGGFYMDCEGRMRVAFVFQVGSFWPSWESIYSECLNDETVETRLFLLVSKESGDKAQMAYAEDFLVKSELEYETFSYEKIVEFSPHYMFYQTPYDSGHRDYAAWSIRYKRMGIRIIYIPYGIEISDTKESRYKHFSLPVVLNADAVYTLSDKMKEEYDKYCINAKAVKPLGLTRFDSLKKEYPLSGYVQEKSNGRKIILWKVHFPKIFIENGIKKQATPDMDEYIKFVDWIQIHTEIFFIFMPHPKFADDKVEPELREKAVLILARFQTCENVYIDKDDEYRNSLTNADAIIVDRSAVMIEAGASGVPVLYMYNAGYDEPMTPPCQMLLDSYYKGTGAEQMISFCNDVQNGIDDKKRERKDAFAQAVPFYDGKCADRIKADLWEMLRKGNDYKIKDIPKDTKVIIFGTGELGEICLKVYESQTGGLFRVVGCVDNNHSKWGTYFHGIPVVSAGEADWKDIGFVVIATDKYYREIYLQLTKDFHVAVDRIMNYDEFIVVSQFGIESIDMR